MGEISCCCDLTNTTLERICFKVITNNHIYSLCHLLLNSIAVNIFKCEVTLRLFNTMKVIIPQALVPTPIATTLASNGTDHVPRTVRPRRQRHGSKTRRIHVSVIKPIQTKKQGVSSVLVVRAIASDAQTTLSEEILFERIFGDTSRTLW
jgi:hypothetical protein